MQQLCASQGAAPPGMASLGRARLGGARRGKGCLQPTDHWKQWSFGWQHQQSMAGIGWAVPSKERQGWAGLGTARQGVARKGRELEKPAGERFIESLTRVATPTKPGVAGRGRALTGKAWHGKAMRGLFAADRSLAIVTLRVETPTVLGAARTGIAWRCRDRLGQAKLGMARRGLARQGNFKL
jgi:hypothetical protein